MYLIQKFQKMKLGNFHICFANLNNSQNKAQNTSEITSISLFKTAEYQNRHIFEWVRKSVTVINTLIKNPNLRSIH